MTDSTPPMSDKRLAVLFAASFLCDGRARSLCLFPRDVRALVARIRTAEGRPATWPDLSGKDWEDAG